MKSDRELMQMALDALDSDNPDIQLRAAIALREHLAEPEPEPIEYCSYPKCQATNGCDGACSKPSPLRRRWVDLDFKDIGEILTEHQPAAQYRGMNDIEGVWLVMPNTLCGEIGKKLRKKNGW